jgi:uncharacterized protein (DUF302 family)
MDGVTTVISPLDHGATLYRLDQVLTERGLEVFARIDHAANAAAVGLDMPPTTVVIFGNARAGTPAMLAVPELALDLPLRVLVREDDQHRVLISYHAPEHLAAGYGVPADLAVGLAGILAVIEAVRAPLTH